MMAKIPLLLGFFATHFLISSALNWKPPSNYSWPLNTKNLCFAARFDLAVNVQYLKTGGNTTTVRIPLDDKTYETYSVTCDQVHTLTIYAMKSLTGFSFQFSTDVNNTVSLSYISGFITINDLGNFFPDYDKSIEGTHKFSSNESSFVANRDYSYQCNSKTLIGGFQNNTNVTIQSFEFENLRIQAFVNETQPFSDYSDAKVCPLDDTKDSNLVPIIVGACLAVLVVIVLVAYLIGRRRSRNGYQSV